MDIVAQAQTDGSLHVTEQRTFDFDGSFTAVWWTFSGLPCNAEVSIESLRMASVDESGNVVGEWTALDQVAFQLDWREEGGPAGDAWSFDKAKDTVYAFFRQSDARVVFELDYAVENGVQAYDDIAEVYWKYVPEGWAVDSENVTMTIELPVPLDTAVVLGDTVRAWGHGPLDGSLAVNEDGTVAYRVPLVRAGQYAEAHVVFPVSWLTNLSSEARLANQGTTRLDTVLADEKSWADQANNQRMISLAIIVGLAVLCVAVLAVAVLLFLKFGREHKPDFTGEYWRDVPAPGMQPAVVGRLWRWNHESADDFTASIMYLAHRGALSINRGSYVNDKGKTVDDYYLTRANDAATVLDDPVERETMRVLFDVVGEGASSLWLGSIRTFGEAHPQEYSDALQGWQGVLSGAVNRHDFFEARSKLLQMLLGVLAAAFIAGGVGALFVLDNFVPLAFMVPTGIALAVLANYMPRRTELGNNITARAKALRNWLRDFSLLDERPPTDVRVWGEFMVYAYLFGVAEQAIKELRNAVPELFADDAMEMYGPTYVPWYVWYGTGYGAHGAAMPSVSDALGQTIANTTSTVQSALSTASAGMSGAGGMGGGFSMGGGGGFGGGGGAR